MKFARKIRQFAYKRVSLLVTYLPKLWKIDINMLNSFVTQNKCTCCTLLRKLFYVNKFVITKIRSSTMLQHTWVESHAK